MQSKAEVVLITGASSGIGAALAAEWARRGARLTLAARRRDRLEGVAAEVGRLGGEAAVVECDVDRDGDPERAVAVAVERWGRLDVVVANAGFSVSGMFADLTLADYRRQLETNVFGLMRTAKAGLDELRRSRGRLALVGSVAGYVSTPGSSAYGMSKFAVRGLAQALRHELRAEGVSVTHVAPGFVASEFRLKDSHGRLRQGARDEVPAWLVVPAEVAAREIVRAVTKRRREVVVTRHGRVLVFVARHAPWAMDWLMARLPAWRRRDLAERAPSGDRPAPRT